MPMRRGIYIHLPFCLAKCAYCDFASVPLTDVRWLERYTQALLCEIEARASGSADTVYFGGGTPSLFAPAQLQQILSTLSRKIQLSPNPEITLEVNPATAQAEAIKAWRSIGINRLSIGVQSTRPENLKLLGRVHMVVDAQTLMHEARSAGFENISCDLMYGLPQQTLSEWEADLQTLVSWAPEHISLYCLTLEPGTPLARRVELGQLSQPDEDLAADMYELAQRYLHTNGYAQYELSNFSRAGRNCRHNRIYWEFETYLGFGAAAHSFEQGTRYWNTDEPEAYCAAWEKGHSAQAGSETMEGHSRLAESLMLGLRLTEGVNIEAWMQRFGADAWNKFAEIIKPFLQEGLLEIAGSWLRLTSKGMLLSNRVFRALV